MPGPVVAHLADDDSGVAGFGRFARRADGFAARAFCALFHGTFHSESSHRRTSADVFYCRKNTVPVAAHSEEGEKKNDPVGRGPLFGGGIRYGCYPVVLDVLSLRFFT